MILGALALAGLAETSVMTLAELVIPPRRMCPSSGCIRVLASPFALLFGVPLSVYGMIAYGTFAVLAYLGLRSPAYWDARTRPWMEALAYAMGTFSAYLMFVLFFIVRGLCPYCIGSAVISFEILRRTARSLPAGSRFWVARARAGLSVTSAGLLSLTSYSMAATHPLYDRETVYASPLVTGKSSKLAMVSLHFGDFQFSQTQLRDVVILLISFCDMLILDGG